MNYKREEVKSGVGASVGGNFCLQYNQLGTHHTFKGRGTNNADANVQFSVTNRKSTPSGRTSYTYVNLTWEEWDKLVAHVESGRPAAEKP